MKENQFWKKLMLKKLEVKVPGIKPKGEVFNLRPLYN